MKSINSVETKAILASLEPQEIEKKYIDRLSEIKTGGNNCFNAVPREQRNSNLQGKVILYNRNHSPQLRRHIPKP